MNKLFLVAVLSPALVFSGCTTPSAPSQSDTPAGAATVPTENHASMDHGSMSSGGHSMMNVTSEQDFLVQMTAHHREAVDSSIALLNQEIADADIRAFVTGIVAMQEREITLMSQWHYQWYNALLTPSTSYMPMMRPLAGLTGNAAIKQYLEDMIVHHEGAVAMAKQVQSLTTRPELLKLAQDIITAQAAEITQMKAWLAAL